MVSLNTILLTFTIILGFKWVGPLEPNSIQEYNFPQTLDHFGGGNLSQIKFKQRIFVDKMYWSNEKTAPMLVYFGDEGRIDEALQKIGTINRAAPKFKALVLYIEHRFYGNSVPFGDLNVALGDKEVRGCLTSQQALVDFAQIIQSTKEAFLHRSSRVIVIGCSYAGMLAAWFRLKFPHIATGALASSAPIFFFDMEQKWDNVYCDVVSNDYKVTNEKCYERIKKSWEIIDNLTLQGAAGHAYLVKIFKICSPLLFVEELKTHLIRYFWHAAQYNGGNNGVISKICDEIVGAPEDDILGGIARTITRGLSCIDLDDIPTFNTTTKTLDSDSWKAWDWQVCNEFIQRLGCGNNTMFQPQPFNLTKKIESCKSEYHVTPQLNWVSTYYGGYDMRSTLKHFGSNIAFTNGLMDPFSAFGVLEDISKTVVALTTKEGSHCLDLETPLEDDPHWLKRQRADEDKILAKWIRSGSSKNPQTTMLWFSLTLIFLLAYYK